VLKNIAIIPIRSGSERFKNKNIRKINGLPLFCIAALLAKQSNVFDAIWIAYDLDDLEIRNYCEKFGFKYYLRSKESATNLASTEDILEEFIRVHKLSRKDWVTIIQATCPFQQKKYFIELDIAIKNAVKNGITSVVTRIPFKRFFMSEVLAPGFSRKRTQDLSLKYLETGLFWAVNVGELLDSHSRISSHPGFVEIEAGDDWDIDDEQDYLKAYHRIKVVTNRLIGYYKKRAIEDSEKEEYYKEMKDPDGNVRNLLNEEQGRLDFAKNELTNIKKYIDQLRQKNTNNDIKILDIGCGNGAIGSALRSNDVIVEGIEPSNIAANIAAKKLNVVYSGPYETSPFFKMNERYDILIAFHVIEHLKDPVSFVSDAWKILKNGGLFLVSTPDFEGPMASLYGEKFRLLQDKTHISLFGTIGLMSLLSDAGFSVQKFDQPFLDTKYCTEEALSKILKMQSISPPFTGNVISIYAIKD
jgi:CMP-N-acetylneuraminic acid synthetase/2-polyprenyl-3-methyl-5-hydroxy-6-metoxy-1,4-benzoquinol methylase